MKTRLEWVADIRYECGRVQTFAGDLVGVIVSGFDRAMAEAAVAAVYEVAGLDLPKFVWFELPSDAIRMAVLWDLATGEAGPSLGIPGGTFRQKLLTKLLVPAVGVIQKDERFLVQLRQRPWRPQVGTVSGFVARVMGTELSQELNVHRDASSWTALLPMLEGKIKRPEFPGKFASMKRDKQLSALEKMFAQKRHCDWLRVGTSVLPNSLRPFDFNWGSGDARSLAPFEFFGDNVPLEASVLQATTKHCWWWRPEEQVCFMVDPPTLAETDEFGSVHGRVVLSDGREWFALRGIEVPKRVAEGDFTVQDIELTKNLETQRVMIEHYGMGRYLVDSGAELVQSDQYGDLFRKSMPTEEEELVQMVRVKNSTAEPDGTYRHYFLRVPPEVRTAREGVAWTFGMQEKRYKPAVET